MLEKTVGICATVGLVDGKGASRVLHQMQSVLQATLPLVLRLAQKKDALCILRIANDPLTRAMSFSGSQITTEEHIAWFDKQLLHELPFYVAMLGDEICGYVRFDSSRDEAKISIALLDAYKGRGLATSVICKACKMVFGATSVAKITAQIKKDNSASIKVFTNAGFKRVDYADFEIVEMALVK